MVESSVTPQLPNIQGSCVLHGTESLQNVGGAIYDSGGYNHVWGGHTEPNK